MLYDKSLERDNCGFGLIAHIEGEPSHKVVRTAIHALARMQHRGAILADGKPATVAVCCCKTRSFLPHRCRRARLAFSQNYAVGMLFLNKDPELAKARAASLKKNFSLRPVDCRLARCADQRRRAR